MNVIFITSKLDQNSEPKKGPVDFISTIPYCLKLTHAVPVFRIIRVTRKCLESVNRCVTVLTALDDTCLSSVL